MVDSIGKPRVFFYPAYLPKQAYLSLEGGHTSNVSCCQFMGGEEDGDEVLVTAGEYDGSMMFWKYDAKEKVEHKPPSL